MGFCEVQWTEEKLLQIAYQIQQMGTVSRLSIEGTEGDCTLTPDHRKLTIKCQIAIRLYQESGSTYYAKIPRLSANIQV